MTRGDRGGFSDRRRLEQFQMLARGVCGERGIEEKDADIPGGARWGPGVGQACKAIVIRLGQCQQVTGLRSS